MASRCCSLVTEEDDYTLRNEQGQLVLLLIGELRELKANDPVEQQVSPSPQREVVE